MEAIRGCGFTVCVQVTLLSNGMLSVESQTSSRDYAFLWLYN